MTTKILLWIMMFLAFAGMLWANRQYKGRGVPWGRPLAALCGVFSLLMAFISIMMTLFSTGTDYEPIRRKEAKYQYIAYKKLGKKIAELHPNAKIVLIRHRPPRRRTESSAANDVMKSKMDGLKEGLGTSAEIVAEEMVSSGMDDYMDMPEGPGGGPGQSYEEMMEDMLTAEKMNQIMETNDQCDVVLSLVGLPNDLQLMKLWKMKKEERPTMVLANAYIFKLKNAVKHDFISIILHTKPVRFNVEDDIPDDEQVAFDKRFLLITKENIEAVSTEYGKLFEVKTDK